MDARRTSAARRDMKSSCTSDNHEPKDFFAAAPHMPRRSRSALASILQLACHV
jgi:hypothetical protein